MPKIAETFNFGDPEKMEASEFVKRLSEMYQTLAIAINKRIEVIERPTDGLPTDYSYSNGTVNINNSTNKVEMITNHDTATTVVWVQLS